jgi:crotonobetainyl-CoA:carnitine CoA-transferase CaiB-like acyl-CoA transferase
MRVDLPHPLSGTVPQVANPLRFSKSPVAYTQAPPLLGEHTAAELSARLGLSESALKELAGRGVIQLARGGEQPEQQR